MKKRISLDVQMSAHDEEDSAARALRIGRIMSEAVGGLHYCPLAICRRQRRCVSTTLICMHVWKHSRPPKTPEERAQAIHELKVAIEQRMRMTSVELEEDRRVPSTERSRKAGQNKRAPPRGAT